uniref:Ribosomal protein L6 n=1 Tax=Babesia duncani TaxID=323732 RepID=A0A385GNI5_9APIC|nr:ribosomal protein L6 [Babesia duncani]
MLYKLKMNNIITLLIIDKYINYIYISLSYNFNNIKNLIILNNSILKFITNNNIKFININNNIKFIKFIITFISKLYTILKFINTLYELNIKITGIFYISKLIKNKLILRFGYLEYIIIYISNINNINITIKQNGYLINLSSFDKNFITTLGSIIKYSKKFNLYTNVGLKYLSDNIKLKRRYLKNV